MTYNKPSLNGYSAIVAIQATGNPNKFQSTQEPDTSPHSQPAYEADE